ncbi:MAG TPA: hypothetical protein VGV89_02960 [Thermoplasmata archaeon]|nr:hypothetical protein [Thermoplasmata archaeon]
MAAVDPTRETFVAILKQLNLAETRHEGATAEQALELTEIERRLQEFGPVRNGSVVVGRALGLLLKNGLVRATAAQDYSWERQREVHMRYQITATGKQFLVDAIEASDRVR